MQYAVLKTAGSLTRSQAFVARLINLRKLVFALATIILMPVLFVLATGHETATQVATAIMIMGASVLVIFLLRRTYMLFIEQKISILYWILYLCGVEIFPVSFLILLVVKNL
mgnify:CR=1 FL=1